MDDANQARGMRNSSDNQHLRALIGRKLLKYFPGYGTFQGIVDSLDADRHVVLVTYEDGDEEEMYLDQLQTFLLSPDVNRDISPLEPNNPKYSTTWPPPSLTQRQILSSARERKPSEAALQRILLEESLRFDRELKFKGKSEKSGKTSKSPAPGKVSVSSPTAAASTASTPKKTAKPTSNATTPKDSGKDKKQDKGKGVQDKDQASTDADVDVAASANKNKSSVSSNSSSSSSIVINNNNSSSSSSIAVDGINGSSHSVAVAATSSATIPLPLKKRFAIGAAVPGSTLVARAAGMTSSSLTQSRRTSSATVAVAAAEDDSEDDLESSGAKKKKTNEGKRQETAASATKTKTTSITTTAAAKRTAGVAGAGAARTWSNCVRCRKRHWSTDGCNDLTTNGLPDDEDISSSSSGSGSDDDYDSTNGSDSHNAVRNTDAEAWDSTASAKGSKRKAADIDSAAQNGMHGGSDGIGKTSGKSKHGKKSVSETDSKRKRWSGQTTGSMVEGLRARVAASTTPTSPSQTPTPTQPSTPEAIDKTGGAAAAVADSPSGSAAAAAAAAAAAVTAASDFSDDKCCALDETRMLRHCYLTIRNKLDITCGADGRYGITGNCTLASMTKMFNCLRDKCELDSSASLIDLGAGMGRPNIHAATIQPHIKMSVGTEFNPTLYHQAMLALRDIVKAFPCFRINPRVFYMDANIKDLSSLCPFTHVYCFNIGMPEDLLEHILSMVARSATVKYLVMYPHRTVTHKRLQQLGSLVDSMSMSMPGGCSYEALVIRVHHKEETIATEDPDIVHVIDILKSPALYEEYVQQLGSAPILQDELEAIRHTRRDRHHRLTTTYLLQSPCLPDIALGFLRRVALRLGVSSTGSKVNILAAIQEYVPVTFSISLFAVGDTYTDRTVDAVVATLLRVDPARRQPEAA